MTRNTKIFKIYSDESGFPSERFQSIAVVTGDINSCNELRTELKKILDKYELSELKWSSLNAHKPKLCLAKEFIDISLYYAIQKKIRIDILYWDIQDSRHQIQGRDDIGNLERMYYKAIRHAINMWAQKEAVWDIYPDELSYIKWNEIADYLNKTKLGKKVKNKPVLLSLFEDMEGSAFIKIREVVPQKSHEEPIVQLADLYAGIARFSKEKGEEYFKWLCNEERKNQLMLFDVEDENNLNTSNKTLARFNILRKLNETCKNYKMRVSLRTYKYLVTKDAKKPINFWFYIPQHEEDKAPIKRRSDKDELSHRIPSR